MAVTKEIFKTPSIDGTADQLADHMPQGEAWEAKFVDGTNLRGLVIGTASPFNTLQATIEQLCNEFNINITNLLIDEWETSVGLPDDCTGALTDIDERRAAVIQRLQKKPIVNLAEMQAFVDGFITGLNLTLIPGREYFGLPYGLPQALLGNVNPRFILVAEIDSGAASLAYGLPQQLIRGIDQTLIRCLLERVIPANVVLVIKEV